MNESARDYLRRVYTEPTPRWLENSEFSLNGFFESRTVYYPGAGDDGSPIHLFNRSHSAHCFVWVDQSYEFNEMMRTGSLDLKGYSICHVHLTDIVIRTDYKSSVGNTSCCHMVVYDRKSEFGDEHGAERLAVLVVRGEAHSTYEQIYGDRFRTIPPWAIVIQDHGLGGNFTNHCFGYPESGYFGSPILSVAQNHGFPRFLLFGEWGGTKLWPGYERVQDVYPTLGGMHRNRRWLCQPSPYFHGEP